MRQVVAKAASPARVRPTPRASPESRFVAYTTVAAAIPVGVVRLMQALIAALGG